MRVGRIHSGIRRKIANSSEYSGIGTEQTNEQKEFILKHADSHCRRNIAEVGKFAHNPGDYTGIRVVLFEYLEA